MRSTTRTAHATRTAGRATHRPVLDRGGRRRPVALVVDVPVLAPVSRAPEPRRSLRLTTRGRVLLVLALAALLFGAFSLGRARTQAATVAEPKPVLVAMTVQPGESLWTVARRIAPDSDPREVVQQLRRINHLTDSGLQAGQQLLLPG